MSIPGLGQLAAPQPTNTNLSRTISLQPFWEWRFEVAFGTELTLKLVSGTAEKDGTELAIHHAYTFSGLKSKILTLQGCELEVEGSIASESVAEYRSPQTSPSNAFFNLHIQLMALRARANAEGREGPRIAICGEHMVGKTTLARTLTSYATRVGSQPIVINTDPKEGMLSLPGTLSASVIGSVLDVEAVDGWGTTPTSGPSQVPVKLPLVYYYGHARVAEDPKQYRELVSKMAATVTAKLGQDSEVKSSGMIIDTPGLRESSQVDLDLFAHVVEELSANIIIVLGSPTIGAEIQRRFSTERTSLGEQYSIVLLDKSDGVVERDEGFMQQVCEASIKEYFFGSVGRTLSPTTQQLDFDSLTIYKLNDCPGATEESLTRIDAVQLMAHWTLALVYASVRDNLDTIRTANVMGYVYVADIDKEKRKLRILAPVSGRLGDRPFLMGKWPEPYINLLG